VHLAVVVGQGFHSRRDRPVYGGAAGVWNINRAGRAERQDHMAIGIYFGQGDFPADKYDEAIRRLEVAGAGAPQGRSYHVALEADGKISVFDVWDSQEAFDAFGATLMPLLTELGVDPGPPAPMLVHNVIAG
jgi:hypothetical protein